MTQDLFNWITDFSDKDPDPKELNRLTKEDLIRVICSVVETHKSYVKSTEKQRLRYSELKSDWIKEVQSKVDNQCAEERRRLCATQFELDRLKHDYNSLLHEYRFVTEKPLKDRLYEVMKEIAKEGSLENG